MANHPDPGPDPDAPAPAGPDDLERNPSIGQSSDLGRRVGPDERDQHRAELGREGREVGRLDRSRVSVPWHDRVLRG
jgi:hypothetical protein